MKVDRRSSAKGIFTVLCAALLLVLATPTPPARAASSFTFYGSAFGHGVGMSQWGAYGLSLKGWGRRRILHQFYQGTAVEQAASQPADLRVGLIQGNGKLHLQSAHHTVRLKLGSPTGSLIGTIPTGETWTVKAVSEQYRIRDEDGNLVGAQLWGSPSQNIFATYEGSNGRLFVQETGHNYSRGHIEFNLYAEGGGAADLMRLIAVLPVQEYLYGISEVPSSWPQAALRSQADAARTYALEKVETSGQNRPFCNCAVVASSADQVYAGWDKEAGDFGERWVAAVDATSGEVITYENALIKAFFHASSGGYTENSENVFVQTLDYLRGVCDPGDYTPNNPNKTWTVGPISAASLTTELDSVTGDIGSVTRFSDPVRGVSGRLMQITVHGSTGEAQVSGDDLRLALSLRSNRFNINRDLSITGTIRMEYDTILCAPGLATTPKRAVAGGTRQRFEVGAIYRNASRKRVIWLFGPTYDKYLTLHESAGILGMPVRATKILTDPTGCSSQTCSRTRFEKGHIYYKESIGAFELHGPVLAYYLSRGGVMGGLRFPISDIKKTATGASIAKFEKGKIRCNRFGGCRRN